MSRWRIISQEEWDRVQAAAREVLQELEPMKMDHLTTDRCRNLEVCTHLQMDEAHRLETGIRAKIPGHLWQCSMAKVAAFDLWRGELRWHGWKTWPEIVASLALDYTDRRAKVRAMEVGP